MLCCSSEGEVVFIVTDRLSPLLPLLLRIGRVAAGDVEQHDGADEAALSRPPLLLPALLGREADDVRAGDVPRPPQEDVPVQHHRQGRHQTRESRVSRHPILWNLSLLNLIGH